ncbi:hypothetical protein VL20_4400 [Microcystis panniformis FACHB-1757]|uniref:Uncharacterized protein n=1 Tax=Microcystis panniformis FACHB-1757 TaxID=1638788 RepID=A0A0K1S5A4_9CHRO|nr:hypothetical protein VL20_4400 [Microcystis panniformis FACHB-1757]
MEIQEVPLESPHTEADLAVESATPKKSNVNNRSPSQSSAAVSGDRSRLWPLSAIGGTIN